MFTGQFNKAPRSIIRSAMIIMLCCCGGMPVKAADAVGKGEPMIVLLDFVPSPDGRIVAFEFLDRGAKQHPNGGIGLVDWKTGKLTRIPNPPGKELGQPSFSPDGTRLVAAERREIAIVDLATLMITEITGGNSGGVGYPIFQPGTDNVLYGDSAIPSSLRLHSLKDHTERVILDAKSGFTQPTFRPSFIGPEEILFQAIAPVSPEHKRAILDLLHDPVALLATTIAYRLRFGESAQLLFPEIERSRKFPTDDVLGSLSVSRAGKMAFIGLSTQEPLNNRREFNWEIFALESGHAKQMTDLRSHISYARISDDGTTVAFGSDPTRSKIFDLSVLDLLTGEVTATGLLGRLQGNPNFVLR